MSIQWQREEGESRGHWWPQLPGTGVALFWERETPRKTWAPWTHMGGVSKPVTSLCTLSLESHKGLQSSVTKAGRKDMGGNLRLCASEAAQNTIKEAGMRQGWRAKMTPELCRSWLAKISITFRSEKKRKQLKPLTMKQVKLLRCSSSVWALHTIS